MLMHRASQVEEGIGNSGLRAGIVGEIGTSWPITPSERNVLMAAARAAKRTGTMLNVHPGYAVCLCVLCVCVCVRLCVCACL